MNGRTGRAAILLGALFIGGVSLETSQASLGLSYLTESTFATVVGMTAGWGLVAVGLETVRRGHRRRFGYLLAAGGTAWFLPEWADPAIGLPVAFTVGLVLAWLYPVVVGHALFVIAGTGRPARVGRVLAVGYVVFVVGLGMVPALGFDPRTGGCGFCPVNLIEVDVSPSFFDAATRIATVFAVGWSLIVAFVLANGLARSAPASRRMRAPILVPGIGFLILVASALGRTIVEEVPASDPIDHLLRLAQAITLIALSIGVVSEWWHARQSKTRVARVVADLAGSPPIGGLRDHLATILGDAELRLAYPVSGDMSVDVRGRPVDLRQRPGRTTTNVVSDSKVVAVIEHDEGVLRDPDEVEEVIAAARLGLEFERLQADVRAQLDTLQAARRRIVEAGDAHRQQLERDLHDGAQQHLIGALAQPPISSIGAPSPTPGSIDAADELRLAMDDLRDVAHGIYASVLGDEGFAAAVDALAEASTCADNGRRDGRRTIRPGGRGRRLSRRSRRDARRHWSSPDLGHGVIQSD